MRGVTINNSTGSVIAIYVSLDAGVLPSSTERVMAIAGQGLEGDRYASQTGTYSNSPGGGRHLTLIEAEALANLRSTTGINLDAAAARRNLLTRGIDLNGLVGKRFRVGGAVCQGVRLCEPCDYLESLTAPGVLAGLVGRGGLRADIIESGPISVGDSLMAFA